MQSELMKESVLFVPIHVASMVEMLPVAEQIAEDGQFEPVFFVLFAISPQQFDILKQRKFQAIGPGLPASTGEMIFSKRAVSSSTEKHLPLRKRFAQWARLTTPIAFLWHWLEYLRIGHKARRILRDERVAALVVLGDRHVGWETAFLKEANQLQISSLIIPYSLTGHKNAVAYRMALDDLHLYRVNTPFRRFIQRKYPAWVYRDGDDTLFFLPLGNALPAQICGIMPENPWVLGGGNATRMAVESQQVQKMLFVQGVPAEKMVVTGRASVDQVSDTIESANPDAIRNEMGNKSKQRILLCAVPHLAEHGMLPWDQHWAETRFLLETLTQQDATVILSLHPKSNPAAYQPLADEYGVVIAKRRAYELIPASDVFVATYSGTVMAAIGCGVPTVLIDFFGLEYNYFDAEPGIIVVKEHADLSPALTRLFTDPAYYAQLAAAQQTRGPKWILLDGQCARRVVDELYQLIDKSKQLIE